MQFEGWSAFVRGASAVPVRRVFTVTSDPTDEENVRSRPISDQSSSSFQPLFTGLEAVFDYFADRRRPEFTGFPQVRHAEATWRPP
jgi:hypothetical protein